MTANQSEIRELVEVFRALSDPTRIEILLLLLKEGDVYQKILISRLNRPQPSISRHLLYLRRRGLVKVRRIGRYTYWSLGAVPPVAMKLLAALTAPGEAREAVVRAASERAVVSAPETRVVQTEARRAA